MLSIIIINYNTFQHTCNCIQSVYNKTKNDTFEIILIDNASNECNPDKFKELFTDIILVKNRTNLGFAKGNNIGISHSKGEYILLLNSDTVLVNDAVSITKDILLSKKEIGVVTAQLQYPDEALQHVCQSFPSIIAELLETTRIFKLFNKKFIAKHYFNSKLNLNQNNYCDWVWGTYFMFRKNDLQKLNTKQLSDQFFMYGEDMEWCYQFKLAGFKTYFCADAKIIHHMGKVISEIT